MGFTDWFAFRTKAQKQAEARRYAHWACPYGEEQRQKLTALLAAILPQEGAQLGMTCYLSGREAYHGGTQPPDAAADPDTAEEKRIRAAKKLRRLLQGRISKEMALYLALIEADAQIDEQLCYPAPDALLADGDEILRWLKEHKQEIKR